MPLYSDLELSIRKLAERSYSVGFRYNGAADDAEQTSPDVYSVSFDPASIGKDPADWGAKLAAAFFTPDIRNQFVNFRGKSQTQNAILRVRLFIDSSAPELHRVPWETLNDPEIPDTPLFMGENTIVSRFLASGQDSKPIRIRAKGDLTALVVIANPTLKNLTPIDTARELAGITSILSPAPEDGETRISITALAPGGPVPLNDIVARLSDDFDILYLVCHGQLVKDEPYLYLEDSPEPVSGLELVQRIRELDKRPRLIVFASCQSAGSGGVAMSGLGPRLANAGVPAIIAMQGNIQMDTANPFMQRFFSELRKDGQIDRAMSVARGAVRKADDCWMPALFLRLRGGRLWYTAGFQNEAGEPFEQWDSICRFVREGRCVPILGPDLTEESFGLTRDLSARIAADANFPLDTRDRYDLAKVAQYIAITQGKQDTREHVMDAYDAQLNKASEQMLKQPVAGMELGALYNAIATHAAPLDADPQRRDPLRIVAGLNACVFVNAANDTLLEAYLRNTQLDGKPKAPISLVTDWRNECYQERKADKDLPTVEYYGDTTPAAPYVYYVYGKRSEDEGNWVLTEDDFFDYLIRTTRFRLMPGVVSDALVTSSLLFLGFPLDDWKFRVLFRMILAKGGRALLEQFNHVGVQVDPGETTFANARMARRYLQKYFTKSQIDIYWGSAADFLRQLRVKLDEKKDAAPARRRGA